MKVGQTEEAIRFGQQLFINFLNFYFLLIIYLSIKSPWLVPCIKDKKWILGSHPYWITARFRVFHFVVPPNISVVVPKNVGDLHDAVTIAGTVHPVHFTLRTAESSQMRDDNTAFHLMAMLLNFVQSFVANIFQ